MATALGIIKRSMRLIGALGSGETPTAEEESDGLDALNGLLDSWWNDSLAVYQIAKGTYTWASGQATRTIGSGGDFDTTRPVRIDSAEQTLNSIDYHIDLISNRQYQGIPDKTTQSTIARYLYSDSGNPLTTLYIWPVPSANMTLNLYTWTQIESFATGGETVVLPPGYRRALEYNLAVDIAPEYQRDGPPLVFGTAANAMRVIRRNNVRIPNMKNEPAMIGRPTAYTWDWRTG